MSYGKLIIQIIGVLNYLLSLVKVISFASINWIIS